MRAWRILPLLAALAWAQEAKDPVAPLLEQAKDLDAKARAKALRALGRARGERAVSAARAALRDPDATVRAAAAVALVRLSAPDASVVEALSAALSHPDWHTRWDACVALGSLGPGAASAAPALLAAAGDPRLDLGREAAIALSRIAPKDPQVVAAIVLLLESDIVLDRLSLLRALDARGNIALAQGWLAKELVANRYGLRSKAAGFLGKCGVHGAASLARGLEDEDVAVRLRAFHELARNEKIGAEIFLVSLSDPTPELRSAAIAVLRSRNAKDAAPRIADLLSDPDCDVRLRAARAIEDFGVNVPGAGPGLVRLVAEGDTEIGVAALAAMRRSGFAALASFLEREEEREAGTGHPVFCLRLRPRGGGEDLAVDLQLVATMLADNRHGAALEAALKEVLAKDEDQVLAACLASDDETVRRAAAALLGRLARDREAALLALFRASRDPHPAVREAAADAIQHLRAGAR